MVTAIDLCAGAGGLTLGLRRAGFDVLGVELDADACATHRANVGPCEQASIVGWHPPHPVVLVAGGVPCQPYSMAGKREGTAREDGRLYLEQIRIGQEAEAEALLLENVKGMVSWRDADGTILPERIAQDMQRGGWPFAFRRVLCAASFGTPQLRYRLFIAAFRSRGAANAFRWPEPVFVPEPNLFGVPVFRTVREALGLSGRFVAGLKPGAKPESPQGMRMIDVDRPSPTIGRVGELLSRDGVTYERLTLQQRAILQGFPDGFAFVGNAESCDKQCANAVPPQLGEAVGRAVFAALGAA